MCLELPLHPSVQRTQVCMVLQRNFKGSGLIVCPESAVGGSEGVVHE
jgi:hypothetical protein